MDPFERIFGHSSGSAATAKKRLQVVLTQDRTNISPEALTILKDEIVGAISKHVQIETGNVEVSIVEDESGHRLTVDIPVVGTRRTRKRAAAQTKKKT